MARILVVDDERDIATMITLMLERERHEVTTAYDGRAALNALGIEPADAAKPAPNLVILDLMMPAVDGYNICMRMNDDPRTKKVPVIMLTALFGARGSLEDTPNVVAQLDKPFDPQKLMRLVADTLKARA